MVGGENKKGSSVVRHEVSPAHWEAGGSDDSVAQTKCSRECATLSLRVPECARCVRARVWLYDAVMSHARQCGSACGLNKGTTAIVSERPVAMTSPVANNRSAIEANEPEFPGCTGRA